jgi:SAM-dependent methyltransferase
MAWREDSLNPMDAYTERVAQELARYAEVEEVHDLPPIYHHWSARHCLPLLVELGYASLDQLWDEHVAEVCRRRAPERARLVSLGAGNGETEIGIAQRLADRGTENLELELLELNGQMLERAVAQAAELGLADRVIAVEADLNTWSAQQDADVFFANHSLHHVVELERLFAEVRRHMRPDGVLLVNDMIGRNGHVRWPEARAIVDVIWRALPAKYRWNKYAGRADEIYPDIDCSGEGFEGMRAQDILPLLLESFHPDVFVTFANVIDPFVDRLYGPNFDASDPEDIAIIEALGRLDDAALDLAIVSPTHLIGSFRAQPVAPRYPRGRSPERALRIATPDDDVRNVTDRLAGLEAERAEAWGRYHELRGRRAVRLALWLAALRHRARARLGGS